MQPDLSGNGSRSSDSRSMVPKARAAMDKFRTEAPGEVGVTLNKGCSGALTSREAGSVRGRMVKKICPERTLKCRRTDRTKAGHQAEIYYIAAVIP